MQSLPSQTNDSCSKSEHFKEQFEPHQLQIPQFHCEGMRSILAQERFTAYILSQSFSMHRNHPKIPEQYIVRNQNSGFFERFPKRKLVNLQSASNPLKKRSIRLASKLYQSRGVLCCHVENSVRKRAWICILPVHTCSLEDQENSLSIFSRTGILVILVGTSGYFQLICDQKYVFARHW